jgi:hypothetical protein
MMHGEYSVKQNYVWIYADLICEPLTTQSNDIREGRLFYYTAMIVVLCNREVVCFLKVRIDLLK